MATPSEKLSEALEALHTLQSSGIIAIQSNQLSRTHRERLLQNGFLQEVMKGWYIPSRPDEIAGDSTTWYAAFWPFCASYLSRLKGNNWCLSPEQSLLLHAENWTIPKQLLVRADKAQNNITKLPHNSSMFIVKAHLPELNETTEKQRLRVFSLAAALVSSSPKIFKQYSSDVRATLAAVQDVSELLNILLKGGHSTIAGRLAGAFRNIGQTRFADEIINTMKAAGYSCRENDPFTESLSIKLSGRELSPYVNRIKLIWQEMRDTIIEGFPSPPGIANDNINYLKKIDDIYITDAYHSLSIEGYRVSRELIEQVKSGNWNPDQYAQDGEQRNALAARGYWQAYQAVRESVSKILNGAEPGQVASNAHRQWYRELFAPGVTAGIIKPTDLAGYRNAPVYIRRSMHVPPSREAVRDVMPVFFELLSQETQASVRVVLGHFIFVYIHPYMDGNGRLGRFLMNTMLISGGYPWTIIPLEKRKVYMSALEQASVNGNIKPFTEFLAGLINMNSDTKLV